MPSAAVAPKPRPKRRRAPAAAAAAWWGEGPPPHERWPGVTIAIPATWSKDRKRWESPDGRYYFDVEAADKACDFFPTFLTHHIGEFADRAFELLDYQRALIVRPLFGWKRVIDDTRRFRFLFGFLPKGNGKSPLGSGLGLFLTLCDEEPAAEVYAIAGDKDQAKIVHESAKIMVEKSADLLELCQVLRDSIYVTSSRSFYKVIASDAGGAHGNRPHGVIFDELHNQPNRDLFEAMRKSLVKRRQPLFLIFTHAGDDDEGIAYEEYEHAKRVLDGTSADESYLPVVFEADAKEDWTQEAVWHRVNPAFGVTINPSMFAAEARAASEEPRKRNDFLRFNLNRWTGQAEAWIPIEWWDDNPIIDTTDLELAAALGKLEAAAGLDCAQKIDLFSFVVTLRRPTKAPALKVAIVGETPEGEPTEEFREISLNFEVIPFAFFWLPEETVREREKDGISSYRAWAQAGHLTITEGATIDYERVYRDITTKIVPRFPMLKQGKVGYDPAFATDIAGKLRDKAGLTTFEVLQNYSHMNEPCQVFEGLVKARHVPHEVNPLLRFCVENVVVKRDDAGRIRPVRPKKGHKKIDGQVATLMGIKGLMAGEPPARPRISVFGARA
jgi:phage terminase large subunit-like protein